MSSQSSSSKVKRKPPPAFPYSPRYPEPDPTNPFVPLSILRARAQSSNTTLVNPSIDSHVGGHTSSTEATKTQFSLTPDAQTSDFLFSSPTRLINDPEPQRPWYGLAKGYLSDASKPLRPPRSRKRPSTGRDTTYFSDVDLSAEVRFQPHNQPAQSRQQPRNVMVSEATPRERPVSVQRRDSQYHYRRRSQSVFVSPPSRRASAVPPALGPGRNASESAQYAYGDRQSHGYMFNDMDNVDDYEYVEDKHGQETTVEPESSAHSRLTSHSSVHSDASTHSMPSRHPTPPMTPDDTLSTMSNSPLGDNTFVEPHSIEMSPPVPLKEVSSQNASKPIPIPNHDVVLRSNRDTIMAAESNRDTIVVADTPATGVRTIHSDDFSILQLPPTAPPQPSPPAPSSVEHHEPPPPPPVQSTSRPPTRHVESDPETSVFERRRSRAGSVSEMRRRLRKSSNVTSTIRSKVISNPMPVVPPTATRKPSFASDSSASVSHGTEVRGSHVPPVAATALARLNQRAAVTSDSETNPRLAVPKPKKSLSHVNLGLKPLPNMSLAPTVATSANTSMASAFGNLSLPRTREDLEMPASLQNAPVTSHVDHHVLPKRAQTDVARFASETLGMGSHIPQIIIEPEYYDSDPEDLATYSILTDFTMALSPIFPIAASTPGGLDRTDSLYPHQEPSPVQEDQQVLTAFAHRGYTRQTPPSPPPSPPPPRVESPLPRVVSPVPNAAPARVEQPKVAAPLYYRNPAPLPLTPPPRAKSPIAAQFHPQQLHAQLDVQQPATQAPTRARSPPPAPSRSKTVPEVRQVHREDPPARAKTVPEVRQMMHQREEDERSSQRSRDREDNGYLPVAQLRPTMSRQQTMQSQASMRRSTNVRGGSQQLFGGGAAKTQGQAQEAPAEVRGEVVQTRPARTQSPVPIRVRSPEPTLRVPAKTQVPMKDLDSPLPPPPMEVLSPAALIRDRSPPVQTMMRSPGVQTRSATMPDISSPVPTQSSPSQHLQQSPAGMPPRRYRTAPSTPALGLETPSFGGMHSHGHEMHGRSCTPTQSAGSRPLDAYPPLDFDEDLIPSKEQLARAASLVVIAQNGVRVAFGDIFREKKVVVCFIRHFWCPLCQDYMYSISRNVNPDALRRAGVDLVVIGNGSPAMIKSYKNIFHTPFSLYTDPTLCVYNALGMTLRTNDAGPDSERGQYVRHGLIGGIAMVVRNALRVGMPVWERGGDIPQLGGEFVFGPGLTCTYAHRMRNTRSHAPILEVLAAAGIQQYAPRAVASHDDEDRWMARRDMSLERMRTQRERRRDCSDPRWCGLTDEDGGSSGLSHANALGAASWESRDLGHEGAEDADTEEDRTRRADQWRSQPRAPKKNLKKTARSYRVANPDRRHPPREEKYELWHPQGGSMVDELGRKREHDSAYMLTHEALSYSFGNRIS